MKLSKEQLLVLTSPLFLLFQENYLSYIFLIIWSIVSLFLYIKDDKKVLYTFLIINTYQVFGYSIYKNNFLFISIIYSIILFLFVLEFKKIKNTSFLILAFIILFPVRMILGVFFMFSLRDFIIEFILFFCFLFFLNLFYNNSEKDKQEFLGVLKRYILFYFPYLTLISLLKGEMIDLKPFFLDEFGHFYLISIIPIILFAVKSPQKRFLLLLFHIIFIVIRFKLLYISSFAFIGAAISFFLLIIFNFNKTYKYVIAVTILSIISFNIINNSKVSFGKHKIEQITKTTQEVFEMKNIQDLKKVPNSPKTRIIEVLNINSNLINSGVFTMLFGRGFGSYFTDSKYSFKKFNVRLDSSAYSQKELDESKYLRPHNSIPYVFLKMGYFGVLFILALTTYSLFIIPRSNWLLYVYAPYVLILFGAGLKNFIIIGILTGIILSKNQLKIFKG